ncbi:tail fiber domain-containing protein [Aquirufa sp. HETE-83D]|uniref:Tail fiber domain-containing protein n=1 Tax=Aquirufa esocilacus TaxID=3096513 RepID=A0ABW6DIP5_9BACT
MKKTVFFLLISVSVFSQTGIGTTTPAVKLHVKSNGGIFRMEGSDHAYMELYPQGSSTRYGYFGYPAANSTTLTLMNQFSTGALTFGTNNANRMWLNADGKLGLGTATPGTSLHIENTNNFGSDPSNTTSPSLYILNTNNASTSAHSTATIRTGGSGGGNPYLSFDLLGVKGYSMGIDNADGDKFKFQNNWSFNNAATPALTITTDNRVGIGTTTPEVPLHVSSSVAQYVSVYGYLNQNQAQGAYTANTNVYYSIMADQRIRCPEFNAISDVRIKKDILKLNTGNTLSELNKLQVVNYAYIDQLANGNKTKTGFIAQEVEVVNDQFVNQSTDFIPSVFALAKSVSLQEDALRISTEKPHYFAKGDVVKFFAEGKKEIISTVESITDSQTFTIKGWTEATDNVFVYGKKISDFRAIDFDQITALSVGAIQELSKQMDSLKLENEKLNKEVQAKNAEFENRLKRLESKLK